MRTSELIGRLQQSLSEKGDLEVVLLDPQQPKSTGYFSLWATKAKRSTWLYVLPTVTYGTNEGDVDMGTVLFLTDRCLPFDYRTVQERREGGEK